MGTVPGTGDNTGEEDQRRPLGALTVYKRDRQQPCNLANKMITDCHQSWCGGGVVSGGYSAWGRGASFGSGGQGRPLWEGALDT